MRTRVAMAMLLATMGCASAATPAPETGGTSMRTIEVSGMAGKLNLSTSTATSSVAIASSLDKVWRVLPAALDSLGVPVSRMDAVKHVIGNEGFKLRVTLGKTPLSRYMDCGQTQIGANADSYDVYLTVLAQAVDDGNGGTTLSTTFDAAARPIAFSQDYSRCSSKGLFESRLADAVKKQLR